MVTCLFFLHILSSLMQEGMLYVVAKMYELLLSLNTTRSYNYLYYLLGSCDPYNYVILL